MKARESSVLDLRLFGPAIGLWVGAFLAISVLSYAWSFRTALWFGCAVVAIALTYFRNRIGRVVMLAVAAVLVGVAISSVRVMVVDADVVGSLVEERAFVHAQVVVGSDPVSHAGRVRGDHRSPEIDTARAMLVALSARGRSWTMSLPIELRWAPGRIDSAEIVPTIVLDVTGRLAAAQPGSGRAAVIDLSEARLVEGPSAISTATTSLRGGLRDAASDLPGDAAQLLPGLAVGDTSRIDANLIDDMRAAGLTHLTAVSGSNVAMIVVVILALATALRVRGRWRFAIGVLAILGFVALVRPDPSVLRAAAMGTIALLPVLLGGRARAAASLCAAVFVLLLLDPWLAVSYGFGLSVFATGGLIVGSSRLTASLRGRLPGGVWPWLIEAAAVTMCAQIAVAPLLAAMGGSLGLASIPANVLAAPAVAPATALGIASALASAVNPVAAQGIAWVAAAPTEWIAVVAHMCAGIPGGALAIPTGPLGAGIVLAVMGALALIWTARARVRRGSVAAYSQVVARPKTSVTVFAVVLVVGYLVPPGGTGASWPPQGWVMVACDVGQGDAVALRVSDQAAVVVDAGPDPKLVDRCLSDMGITSIPLLVLTHFHADHVEGVPGVLRGRSVGLIEVSPLAEPTDGVRRVSVWAHDAGVPIRTTQVGETGAVGIVGWRVLWPQRLIHGEGSDPNNASVVMLVRLGGLRILLTGDVEPAAQLALRRNLAGDPGLRDLDVVKVPHHGSRHQDPGSAMWWRPRVALISVGAGNDYGHPAQDTIAAYEAEGSSVLRTDHQGDIAIVVDSQGLRAVSRR